MLAATPTMEPAVNIICQDRRLVELCDTNIVTAILSHQSISTFNTAQMLAAAAVLRRIAGRLTVVELCALMTNQPGIVAGAIALTQDGVGSFATGLGNFLDFGSGFSGGMMFVSKERFEGVWEYLNRNGVDVPLELLTFNRWEINQFGEAGIYVKPVHLAMNGNMIHD